MSCLRIKLFPAKRAWKSFTTKFHKHRGSKTKPKTRYGFVNLFLRSSHRSRKQLRDRDSHIFHIHLKRGFLFKKKRRGVVYVDKLFFREPIAATNWIPAKQWKPEEELLPERGIDERAEEFINRVKAEMMASRNL